MATVFIGAGLALAVALLVAIHRKLDIDRRERPRDDATALAALRRAATVEVATITAALRAYEEHVAEQYQQMVAASETRARVAEQRSSDAGVALSAASDLVRELRAALDGLAVHPVVDIGPPAAAGAAFAADPDDARRTVPMGARAASDDHDEPEEELTAVTHRPIAGTAGTVRGLRLTSRGAEASGGSR